MRSRPASVAASRRNTSETRVTWPCATSCCTSFSPSPSMSSAPRLAKCRTLFLSCAGQSRFGQRVTASSSSRTASARHTGQCAGIFQRRAPRGRLPATTATICGITSPARCTSTVSPTRTSLRSISSWLWSEAFETVTPPTRTGRSFATGVSAPVRPTCTSIASTTVVSCCGGNLKAIAQRGERGRLPISCCHAMRFTLKTVPSTSIGSCSRAREHARVVGERGVDVRARRAFLATRGSPSSRSRASVARPGSSTSGGQALGDRVGAELERAQPRDVDVLALAQRSRRGIARVHEGLLAARFARRRFRRSKARSGSTTSPRTDARRGGCAPSSAGGMLSTSRRFAVTSSPTRPSPRVAPTASRPFSYTSSTRGAVQLGFAHVFHGRFRRRAGAGRARRRRGTRPRPWRCRATASGRDARRARSPPPWSGRRHAGWVNRDAPDRAGSSRAATSSRSSRSYSASEISGWSRR